MTIEQLRGVLDAKPFRPFLLHLADGRSLSVPHRDFISHAPNGRTLIVYNTGDGFSIVDLLLVTELEVVGAAAEAGGEQT
ncbi:MAG TPA: hypothetical protein VIK18_23765 [Pirellulales bacterium]